MTGVQTCALPIWGNHSSSDGIISVTCGHSWIFNAEVRSLSGLLDSCYGGLFGRNGDSADLAKWRATASCSRPVYDGHLLCVVRHWQFHLHDVVHFIPWENWVVEMSAETRVLSAENRKDEEKVLIGYVLSPQHLLLSTGV